MKTKALTLLVVAVASSVLYGQTKAPARLSKEYIEVFGRKLRLGMTKDEVAEKLSGTDVIKAHDDSWLVGPEQSMSSVQFKNGRLSFADRSWGTRSGSADGDIVGALFGAVTSLNNDGYSQCRVFADTRSAPEEATERVWVDCGKKSILIRRTSYENGHTYNEVSEHLGIMRDVSD